jgi:hypothetical protein
MNSRTQGFFFTYFTDVLNQSFCLRMPRCQMMAASAFNCPGLARARARNHWRIWRRVPRKGWTVGVLLFPLPQDTHVHSASKSTPRKTQNQTGADATSTDQGGGK